MIADIVIYFMKLGYNKHDAVRLYAILLEIENYDYLENL
jgi:hypothetical protein